MSHRSARPPSKFRRPTVWIGIAAAVGLVALLAVVILPTSTEGDPPDEALRVSMVEMAFVPSELHASPGQEVYVTNDGNVRHSLLVVGLGRGVEAGVGGSRSFTLPDDVTGTYRVICDIPGHTEAGMVASLTISDAEVVTETPEGD